MGITGNQFISVKRGILEKGGSGYTIEGNSFTGIPQPTGAGGYTPYEHYGVFVNASMDFNVSNNQFTGIAGVNPLGLSGSAAYGVIVSQTERYDSPGGILFDNTFTNCDYSIQAQGHNGTLDIRCNNFNNSEITAIPVTSYYGASLKDQGLGCQVNGNPAGNEWSTNCDPLAPDADGIPNEIFIDPAIVLPAGQNFLFRYFAYREVSGSPFTNPKCSSIEMLNTECNISKNNQSCLCKNPPCSFAKSINTSTSVEEIDAFITAYLEEKMSLGELLANGDKQQLLNDILCNLAEGLLKNKLLAFSPYLSDRILIAAIKQKPTPLASGILKQIIEANSPVSSAVMYEIEHRVPVIPNGIMKQIRSVQTGASVRFDTERRISWLSAELLKLRNMLVEAMISGGDIEAAKELMLSSDNVYDKQRLTQIFIQEGDYSAARGALNLVTQFTPADKITEALNYVSVMNIMIDMAEQQKSLFEINEVQEQSLRDVAASGTPAALQAEAILETIFGETFPAVVSKIQTQQNKLMNNNVDDLPDNRVNQTYVKLYPNPNNSHFIIEYNLYTSEDGNFEIFNILGDKIFSIKLNNSQGMKNIENITLANGTYYYQVKAGNTVIAIDKFIVIK